MNYRVAGLGFLALDEKEIPGNAGLFDQRLALQWVKDNIADYGGDTTNITLFGESAGGRSVSFQLISPVNTASLFQRGIVESGSALSLTYINRDPMPVFLAFSKQLNCTEKFDIMLCLRSKSTNELLQAATAPKRPFPFFPIVDGEFLPHDLGRLLSTLHSTGNYSTAIHKVGNLKEYDLLGGWNNQEGLMYLPRIKELNNRISSADYTKGVSSEVLNMALKEFPFYKYGDDDQSTDFIVDIFTNFYMAKPHQLVSENRSVEEQRLEIYTEISG